jgi:plasmid maintenance system antidote protein VapI
VTAKKITNSVLRSYIDEVGELPADVLLGRIVVFTITEEPIRLTDIKAWFNQLDLDPAMLPHPNKTHDAFKKATKELDRESYAMTGGRTGLLMCREVSATANYINRQITREVRDASKRKLSYDEAISCMFYRPDKDRGAGSERLTFTVRADNLEPDELTTIQAHARKLEQRYRYHFEHLDGAKIRACIRGYLKKLNSVEIKPGVYYVSTSRDDELGRLTQLVGKLGGGCHMNLIPIVNLKSQREFITAMFEREARDALQGIQSEIDELLKDRKTITPAAYARMKGRYDEVLANAEEHMLNLQVTQDITAAEAVVADEALSRLQQRLLED